MLIKVITQRRKYKEILRKNKQDKGVKEVWSTYRIARKHQTFYSSGSQSGL
jgi:hypothetical protein